MDNWIIKGGSDLPDHCSFLTLFRLSIQTPRNIGGDHKPIGNPASAASQPVGKPRKIWVKMKSEQVHWCLTHSSVEKSEFIKFEDGNERILEMFRGIFK